MNEVEQRLREWCEQHPGWESASRAEPDTINADRWTAVMILRESRGQTFSNSYVWSRRDMDQGRVQEWLEISLRRRAEQLIRAVEEWIAFHTGGGCTPTRES